MDSLSSNFCSKIRQYFSSKSIDEKERFEGICNRILRGSDIESRVYFTRILEILTTNSSLGRFQRNQINLIIDQLMGWKAISNEEKEFLVGLIWSEFWCSSMSLTERFGWGEETPKNWFSRNLVNSHQLNTWQACTLALHMKLELNVLKILCVSQNC